MPSCKSPLIEQLQTGPAMPSHFRSSMPNLHTAKWLEALEPSTDSAGFSRVV